MIEVKVPQLAESINEGTISKWLKEEGDVVQAGDILLELETDKVNLEISAEQGGILLERLKQEGETVTVGEVIARLAEEGEGVAPGKGKEERQTTHAPSEKESGEKVTAQTEQTVQQNDPQGAPAPTHAPDFNQLASPAARRRARRQGVEPAALQSTSVQEQTVARAQREIKGDSPSIIPPVWDQPEAKPVERIPMSRRRQTIAKRLVEAQHTAAMLTTFNEVDMSAIIRLRNKRKEAFYKAHGVKLGYMSFFTKAVVGALKKFPLLNAEIVENEILVKKYYDIGIAVSTEQGLVVPVVRDADKLSFAQIEAEIASLAEKARQNKLSLEELQGGTFTITNGGIFGSLLSTPILNPPQVGILGMHKIQTRPVAIDEERYENRPMMYIALSYDHRIVDGREAVSFLVKVKELLEDPETLLLEG